MEETAPAGHRATRMTLAVVVAAVVTVLAGVVAALALSRGEPAAEVAPGAAAGGPVPFDERIRPDAGGTLPDGELEGFAGAPPVDPADYRGRPLVVNFWATWCEPCTEEMPAFQEVAAETEGDVAFLGVDVADAPRQAEPFVEELGITYDLAVDATREYAIEAGVATMPTTLFVDADGTIVHRELTPMTADELRAALAEHLDVPS